MNPPNPSWLGLLYAVSEIYLGLTHRAGSDAKSHDKKSLRTLWIVILASVFLGISAASWFPFAIMPWRHSLRVIGFFVFVGGLILRWYSVGYLGRFFTVDVAIHTEHHIIESGPYRLMRHPSYTGAIVAFIGLGLSIGNWISFLVFTVPTTIGFLLRIKVEEQALIETFGNEYRSYAQRTKRLLPLIY
jgi:protein-S-isoprenylcysteine O-methyltransferase Ste14